MPERKPPTRDVDDANLEVETPETWAAGIPGIWHAVQHGFEEAGATRSVRTLRRINQKDGFDCMSLRVAGPRRTGTSRSSARTAPRPSRGRPTASTCRPRLLGGRTPSRDLAERSRVLARPAGPADRAGLQAGRQRPLRADQLGRGLRRRRRRAAGARLTRRGDLLHVAAARATRPRSSTSCSSAPSAPTTCPTARTCATSRRASRLRRPSASARRPSPTTTSLQGRPDHHHGPEPGHQPPADAHRAGGGEAQRRQDRRRQPAARSRAHAVQEPAAAQRNRRQGHPARRPVTCQIRLGGDMALLQAVVQARARGRGPGTRDGAGPRSSSTRRPLGLPSLRGAPRRARRGATCSRPPASRNAQIDELADRYVGSQRTIISWAMGLTQHQGASPRSSEIVNLHAAARQHRQARRRRSPRSAGTATCRATGRWASGRSRRPASSTRWRRSSASGRRASTASTSSTRSGRCGDGEVKVLFALGGNFVAAVSDTDVAEAAHATYPA